MAGQGPETVRAELARRALRAACSVDGVVGPAPRMPLGVLSAVGPAAAEGIPGVTCLPEPGGGYRLELHLVAGMVPLPPLADRVRDRIERDLGRAGLGDELRSIDVAFDDVDESAPQPRRRRLTRRTGTSR